MGWLFSQPSKEALIRHLLDPRLYNGKILDSSVRGNRLWVLFESPQGHRIIGLFLMEVRSNVWGYKDMDETVHPYYYDCPLRLINKATEPLNELSETWREAVRKHHANKAATPKPRAGLVVTYNGIDYRLDDSLGRRGWSVTRIKDGASFRMKAAQLSEALKKATAIAQEAA